MDPNRIQCYRKENKNWATHKHQNEVFKFFEKHEKNWGFPFTYNNNETHCSNVSFCFSNTRCQHGSFSIFSICLKCVIFHFIVTISVNHFVPANRLLGLHWIIFFLRFRQTTGIRTSRSFFAGYKYFWIDEKLQPRY